jgi:hypothetical protein
MEDEQTASGTSRREVLRATGATAVGVASFFAAAGVISQTGVEVVDAAGVTHIPTKIDVSIGGKSLGKVRSVGTVTRVATVVTSVDSSGKVRHDRENSLAQVTLSRVFDGDATLRTWYAGKAVPGTAQVVAVPQDVILTLRGRRGSQISQVTVTGAWPSEYDGPSWTVPSSKPETFVESVKLVVDTVELS